MIVSNLPRRNLSDYRDIIGDEGINRIISMADKVKGYSITHVNSTSFGGGVAELLRSIVPIMNSIGVKTSWEVIEASWEFFIVTKKIHNALQGAEINLTNNEKQLYLEINRENAINKLRLDSDIIIVHDPQPLALRKFTSNNRKWIWRCHIDLSSPYKGIWNFISEILRDYNASIFHMKEYIHPEIPTPKKYVMPPSIDPLSDKNRELSQTKILKVLNRYGIDPNKPILIQVARFDPWKDPLGAIDTYRLVKREIPHVQLLLIASMAHDDPEGWIYLEKAIRHAGEDRDIHFLTNLIGVGSLEVNAFQRAASIALQLSIREGFGLAVAEALWKRTPVVARPSGGIKLQVIDGETGYLVNSIEEAARKVIYLLKNPSVRKKLGENGHRHIKENFIITKHIENYLKILKEVIRNQ
ncbi:MAG: glycosyl transferase family 1 [Thermoprotei archaeon]|nr:MAG: glycosyl transferase family 1 [Thermoprotei archaeon]